MTALAWRPGDVVEGTQITPGVEMAIKSALTPAQAMGLTAWREAEARLEPGKGWVPNPIDAMTDILNVIDNRVQDPRWAARGYLGVCHQRWQFSCWERGGGAANWVTMMEYAQQGIAGATLPTKLRACIEIAQSFITQQHPDLLQRSTHYYATWLPEPPSWASGRHPVVERFGHRFFNDVP